MNYKAYIEGQKKRNKKLVTLRAKDPIKWTYRALGEKFDITPQRAEQICRKGEK